MRRWCSCTCSTQPPARSISSSSHIPGITAPLWFIDPEWAKPALLILGLWGAGNAIILYLAGLLNVPRELYEAITVEGANAWQRFKHVTLPMITPVILFTVITGMIDSFQYFDQAYVASTTAGTSVGDPQGSLMFYGVWLYQQALHLFPHGLRLRAGLGAVRGHDALHAHSCCGRRGAGSTTGEGSHSRRRRTPAANQTRPRPAQGVPDGGRQPRRLIAVSLAFVIPVLFMFLTAVMTDQQALSARLIPHPFVWSNFVNGVPPAADPAVDVEHVPVCGALDSRASVLSCVPVAYAFARLEWKGRNVVFLLVLATLMLPTQVTSVPLYILWARQFHDWTGIQFIGTLKPLIIPSFFGDAFSIFLLRQFFMTIPKELTDAMRVDGAGEFQILMRVVVPLAKPAIAAVALFNFIYAWNDFYGPLVYLSQNTARPDAFDRTVVVSRDSSRELESDDGGGAAVHAADRDHLLPRPARVYRRHHADRRQGVTSRPVWPIQFE